jgi:hypothetical protein
VESVRGRDREGEGYAPVLNIYMCVFFGIDLTTLFIPPLAFFTTIYMYINAFVKGWVGAPGALLYIYGFDYDASASHELVRTYEHTYRNVHSNMCVYLCACVRFFFLFFFL